MPFAPFPVDGTIKDRDGITVRAGTVVVVNCTTGERISGTANASGQFILDLGNLTSGYTIGDHIHVTAFYGTGSGRRTLSKRFIITTGMSNYECGSMVLHSGEEKFDTCHIFFASVTNSTAGGLYVDFYDRNDNFVFRIECLGGYYADYAIGYVGVKMDNGFIRIWESETAGSLESLVVVK